MIRSVTTYAIEMVTWSEPVQGKDQSAVIKGIYITIEEFRRIICTQGASDAF